MDATCMAYIGPSDPPTQGSRPERSRKWMTWNMSSIGNRATCRNIGPGQLPMKASNRRWCNQNFW